MTSVYGPGGARQLSESLQFFRGIKMQNALVVAVMFLASTVEDLLDLAVMVLP